MRIIERLVLAFAALGALGGANPRGIVVELAAGPHDRADTPIVYRLPSSLGSAASFTLTRLQDHRPVPVQVVPSTPRAVAWILDEPLAAGATRRYRLEATAASAPERGPGVACIHDDKNLELKVDGKPVLTYHMATVESPSGIDPVFRRSGQIHPLLTPSGLEVTDDFPPDHAHQHALFFAWVNTTFGGRHVDFWNQKEKTGTVEHARLVRTLGGPVFGEFEAKLRHVVLNAPGGPRPALDETWTVRAYRLSKAYVVDLESDQTPAGDEPLMINKYHYGGFGIRGNRQWFDPSARGNARPDPARSGRSDFLTSEGKGRRDGNHTRPRWVDLSGKVGAGFGGVAILDSPTNFRFPQPVRLHPNKPYFVFAPMVLGEFAIEPGSHYVSRYRLVVHDGPPDVPVIERAWRDYAEPPVVRQVDEAG
jgi:hypothetical protein